MTITVNAIAPCKSGQPHMVHHGDVGVQLQRHHVRSRHDEEHEDHQGHRNLHARVRGRAAAGKRPSERVHQVGGLRPEQRPHPGEGPRWFRQPVVVPGQHRDGDRQKPRWRNARRTSPKTAGGGIASFGDLIDQQPGVDYTLVASSTGFAPVTSGPFTIADVDVPCVPDVDCIGDIDDGYDVRQRQREGGPECDQPPGLAPGGRPGLRRRGIHRDDEHGRVQRESGTRVKEVTISFDAGLEGSTRDTSRRASSRCATSRRRRSSDRHEATVTTGPLPDCDYESPESPPRAC